MGSHGQHVCLPPNTRCHYFKVYVYVYPDRLSRSCATLPLLGLRSVYLVVVLGACLVLDFAMNVHTECVHLFGWPPIVVLSYVVRVKLSNSWPKNEDMLGRTMWYSGDPIHVRPGKKRARRRASCASQLSRRSIEGAAATLLWPQSSSGRDEMPALAAGATLSVWTYLIKYSLDRHTKV